MNKDKIKENILSAVNEYLESTEVWDDAVVAVDTTDDKVDLMEEEEAASLPDSVDVYDIMDFIQMTPDGKWIPDAEAIDSL